MNSKNHPPRLYRILGAIVHPFALAWNVIARTLEGIDWFISDWDFQIGRIVRSVAQAVGRYLWPGRLFGWLEDALDRLWNWACRVTESIFDAIAIMLERFVPLGLRRWLSELWIPFEWAGEAVVDFIQSWFTSRDYWRLLGALPAFLLLLPLVLCLAKAQFYSNRAKIQHYRHAALTALDAEDFAKADLCYRKIAQLGQSERAEFEAALVKAAEGDLDTAYVSVRALAPIDEPGYPPAHFWIAQQLAQGRLNVSTEQRWKLAEKHIQHVLDRNPRDLRAQQLKASLLVSAGKLQEAISKLEQLVHQLPALRLPLAKLYIQQGRPDEAAAETRRLLRFYDIEGGAKRALRPHDYLTWGATALAVGELELAKQVVDKGLAIRPDDERLVALSMELQLASYDRGTRRNVELAQRIEHLSHAIRLAPANEKVLKRIDGLARELGVSHESFQAMLRPILEDDGGSGASVVRDRTQEDAAPLSADYRLNNLLGGVAHRQQDHELAVQYFERQLEKNPESPIAANNLAYELLFVIPTDLARALNLANQAVHTDLRNPTYCETRGQVLVRLQRWEEAIDDLEIAVNAKPGRADIHGALASAYAALGKEELAELHRGQAK